MAQRHARPIPDDWQESDGYCVLGFIIPNSPQWKATYLGVLTDLEDESHWDPETGDPAAVVEFVKGQFSNRILECGLGSIPIWIEWGSQVSYENGILTIQSEPISGSQRVKVWINHDGVSFLSSDTFELTTTYQNFDGAATWPQILDQYGNQVEFGYGDLTDYCGGHGLHYKAFDNDPVFTVGLFTGDVCP